MRRKWIIVVIIASTFSGGLGYFGYITYQKVQTKYLREAIAYEGMANYEEAIKSYEQHLLNHPKDIIAKYQYAMLLKKLDEEDKYINLLCIIASELKAKKHGVTVTPKERDKLRSKEGWKELLYGLFKAATNKALQGDKWRTYRNDLKIILFNEDVYNGLVAKWDEKYSLDTKETEDALETIAEIQAKLAFIYWLEGNKEGVLDVIDLTPDTGLFLFDSLKDTGEDYRRVEGFFTDFLEKESNADYPEHSIAGWNRKKAHLIGGMLREISDQHFDKKEYKEAREVYADIITYYFHVDTRKNFIGVCEPMYNIALTYWNEGDYSSAIDAFLILQQSSPTYNKEEVANKLVDVKKFNKNKRKNEDQVLSSEDKYQIIPPDDLKKLDGKGSITGSGWFEVDLYNGSTWTVNELTIMITVTNKHSNIDDFSRKYKPSLKLYHKGWPLTSSIYYEGLGFELKENQKWSWYIVEARGTKGKTPYIDRDLWSKLQKGHSQARVEMSVGKPMLIEKKGTGQEVWIYNYGTEGKRIITFKNGFIEKIEVKY
jgi:tetratricopeptide (TPR) repeat protein